MATTTYDDLAQALGSIGGALGGGLGAAQPGQALRVDQAYLQNGPIWYTTSSTSSLFSFYRVNEKVDVYEGADYRKEPLDELRAKVALWLTGKKRLLRTPEGDVEKLRRRLFSDNFLAEKAAKIYGKYEVV